MKLKQAALKKETDQLSKERLSQLEKELSDMRDQFQAMSARWENEKAGIGKVQKLREEMEQVNAEIARAEQEYDLNKAAELKYGRLPELQKQLAAAEQAAEAEGAQDSLLHDKVTEEEIAKIVARWTGIPVAKLMEGEREKLLHLPDVLHQARHWPERGRGKGEPRPFCAAVRALQDRKPPHWQLFVPWAHGRGQDRACQGAGGMLCLTTSATWCALICRNTWRNTPCRA